MNKMNTIKKVAALTTFLFLTLLLLSASPSMLYAGTNKVSATSPNTFENPDFAFPRDVDSLAGATLKRAIKSKDDKEALMAAIQICVARDCISKDSVVNSIALIDKLRSTLSAPYSNLAALLEATLYQNIYQSQPWVFSSRKVAPDSVGSDPMFWDKALFFNKISELVSQANVYTSGFSTPISAFDPLITSDGLMSDSGFTLYDFIARKSISLLSTFNSDSENIIPFGTPESTASEVKGSTSRSIAEMLCDYHKTHNPTSFAAGQAIVLKIDMLPAETRREKLRKYLYDSSLGMARIPIALKYYNLYYSGALDKSAPEFYDYMQTLSAEMPSAEAMLSGSMCSMMAESVDYSLPQTLYPLTQVEGVMHLRNISSGELLIFRLPDSYTPSKNIKIKDLFDKVRPVSSVKVFADSDRQPFCDTITVALPTLHAGRYAVVFSKDGKLTGVPAAQHNYNASLINVSAIDMVKVAASVANVRELYIVDAMTQKPVASANVVLKSEQGYRKPVLTTTLKTDNVGKVVVPENYNFTGVSASYRGSIIEADFGFYSSAYKPADRSYASLFTDRAIYRPGDELNLLAIVYESVKDSMRLSSDTKICITLSDANGSSIASDTLQTDAFGHCNTVFKIPFDGLMGSWQLRVETSDPKPKTLGYASFEVAEYKTPTFFVDISQDESKMVSGSAIVYKGKALTYSGMPVSDAEVKYNIVFSPWRYYSSGAQATYGGMTHTDASGDFSITLPTASLKGTRFENGWFRIVFDVTSQAGETQSSTPQTFSFSELLNISPSIPDIVCADTGSVSFPVRVSDMLGYPVKKNICYALYKTDCKGDSVILKKGEFESPLFSLPVSDIASGKYQLFFSLKGDSLSASHPVVSDLILYRNSDKTPPIETSLWMPVSKVVAPKSAKKVKVKVGCSYPDNYLLCTVSDKSGVKYVKWITPKGENIEMEIPAPADNNRVWVTFNSLRDFKRVAKTIEILPYSTSEKLDVSVQSFRSRSEAGSRQQWKFHYSVNGKDAAGIPITAVMTDKALDALIPSVWNFDPLNRLNFCCPVSIDAPYVSNLYQLLDYSKNHCKGFSEILPNWNFYGQQLYGNFGRRRVMIRGGVRTEGETMMMDEAAPVMMKSMMASNATMAEKADEVAASAGDADVLGEQTEDTQHSVTWRPANIPVALFRPNLVTDDKGELILDFNLPDFNTTWKLRLLGYTPSLLSNVSSFETVASKSVMVKNSFPAFLRCGDRIILKSTLYNNSDTTLNLDGNILVINPLDNSVIKSADARDMEVGASSQRVISIELEVPDNVDMLLLRTSALAGNSSDGEEIMVPVLPSSTPVTESATFYLSPSQREYSIALPLYAKGDMVTLQFCNNPVWYCLTALSPIVVPSSESVQSLTRSLYANIVGYGLINRYPSLKAGLADAVQNPSDSLLISNLQKNPELKILSLNNTPWVNNASSETLRLQNLSTLLNAENAQHAIKTVWNRMEKLHNADGGWSWCPGMKSSTFMTTYVLYHLGMLRYMDFSDSLSDFDTATKAALRYCDGEIIADYNRNTADFNYMGLLNYLYVRSFFNDTHEKEFDKIKADVLKKINTSWKTLGISDKAIAAILLSREGNDVTAKEILNSLMQYSQFSAEKGRWYDNLRSGYDGASKLLATTKVLEAFEEIDPTNQAVDQIRQWLVLQRQTLDWGAMNCSPEIIYSLLTSGSDWIDISAAGCSDLTMKIGENTIPLPKAEALSGAFTINLNPEDISGKTIQISRSASGPAWGGVVSRSVRPISEVTASLVPDLKIEKRYYVITSTPEGEKISETCDFRIGQKVRVSIEINCSRDMNYLAVSDQRASTFLPINQISDYLCIDSLWGYKEVRDATTNFFFTFIPKGKYVIYYDCFAAQDGSFASGITSAQSQYAPSISAHSAGIVLNVE